MSFLRGTSSAWIKVLLSTGTLLAIALLVQTVVDYRYVSNSLIQQEARRAAQERVRSIERAVRVARPQDAGALASVLTDLRADMTDQVAALVLRRTDGTVVAASGAPAATFGAETGRRFGAAGPTAPMRESRDGREVLVEVSPCRCSLPGPASNAPGPRSVVRLMAEVALYRDGLSAPFARLRRDTTTSAATALTLLAALSLIALRFGPYVRGKQLEAQMDIGRQVQRDLLSGADSWPAGVNVAAECVPASKLGGDFYDIIALPSARVAFVLGDVSGHGVSAALLMGLIYGAMSSRPWGIGEAPDRAAVGLNDLLLKKSSEERFASLFWCAYDPASHILQYVNAGHLPALWIRRDAQGAPKVDRLAEGGPVLGLLPSAEYGTASVEARAGDLVVLFSDGLIEAANERDEYFGEERLIEIAARHADDPARTIVHAILEAVREFAGTRLVPDDQTLLVVRLWSSAERAV